MSAPVRIEAEAWSDLRFATLARILDLGAPDYALIRTARIWSWQAEHYTPEAPTYVVDLDTIESALGPGGAAALVRARLADEVPGGYRMRGAEGRIEWLWQRRQASRAGGEATKRKSRNKTEPLGQPLGQPGLGPKVSPLVSALVPDQISDLSPPAHAIPPSPAPAPPPLVPAVSPPAPEREDIARTSPPRDQTLDQLWAELESERQRVATALGVILQPLVAHDPGRADLASALVDASSAGKRAELAAQIRHAIAVAASEAEADPEQLRWFSGAIFRPNNLRRLVATPAPKKRKQPARAGPKAAPPIAYIPPEQRAGPEDFAKARAALGLETQPAKETAS